MSWTAIDPSSAVDKPNNGLCFWSSNGYVICKNGNLDEAAEFVCDLPLAHWLLVEQPMSYGKVGSFLTDTAMVVGYLLATAGRPIPTRNVASGVKVNGETVIMTRAAVVKALSEMVGTPVKGDAGVNAALRTLFGEDAFKRGGKFQDCKGHARQALAMAVAATRLVPGFAENAPELVVK